MCDTFIALPPATVDGAVVFGKNSDRPHDEHQIVVHFPREHHPPGATLRCTYIEVPQSEQTADVLVSKPDWMWGAEMGANEHGVVIGNEAVWTREVLGPPALLGMDLVRLGLERGTSAEDSLDAIVTLLERYGQGGACAENDTSFTYHNSFLISDRDEAWIVETAGKFWVAQKITSGVRNISNRLSIRRRFERSSPNLVEHAHRQGLYQGEGEFDFAAAFSATPVADPNSREAWGARLLDEHAGAITPEIMMQILRHHESGICMHGGFRTTASMVSRLSGEGSDTHWLTGRPHPCESEFREMSFPTVDDDTAELLSKSPVSA